MKRLLLYRNNYLGPEILGHLMVFEDQPNGGSKMIFECKTIELEWKKQRKECILRSHWLLQHRI
jgi:hypothetical protein